MPPPLSTRELDYAPTSKPGWRLPPNWRAAVKAELDRRARVALLRTRQEPEERRRLPSIAHLPHPKSFVL